MPAPSSFRNLSASLARLALLCAASLLLPTGCKKTSVEVPPTAVTVTATRPQVGPISEQITADAILAPLAQAALASKVSSPIRKLYVQRGARVRRGQLLVTLEDGDLRGAALDSQGSLEQARAAYATATQATIPEEEQKARLDVEQARAALEVANRTAQERQHLLIEGAIAGRETDTAVAQAVQAQAAYDMAIKHLATVQATTRNATAKSAQGQLTSAQGRYSSAEAQVSYANLRSPISGVVTDRPYFAGETAPVGSPVITIMDTSSLLAKLHLSQAWAQKLHVGDEAEVTVPGVDEPLKSKVSLISPALDPGSTTVEVWLTLRNENNALKAGTPVHTTITGKTVEKALSIPASALLPAADGSSSVMVVGSDNVAHKRPITLGIRTPELVQVTSGLAATDTVITEGSYGLDDGTKVTPTAAGPSAGEKD